jgi:hypothetical protein
VKEFSEIGKRKKFFSIPFNFEKLVKIIEILREKFKLFLILTVASEP